MGERCHEADAGRGPPNLTPAPRSSAWGGGGRTAASQLPSVGAGYSPRKVCIATWERGGGRTEPETQPGQEQDWPASLLPMASTPLGRSVKCLGKLVLPPPTVRTNSPSSGAVARHLPTCPNPTPSTDFPGLNPPQL